MQGVTENNTKEKMSGYEHVITLKYSYEIENYHAIGIENAHADYLTVKKLSSCFSE